MINGRGYPDGLTREETPLSGDADLEYVTKIAESKGIEDAARCLRVVKPDVTAFVCTAGSFIKGIGGDLEIARREGSAKQPP